MKVKRRDLLRAAVSLPALAAAGGPTATAQEVGGAARDVSGMNVLLFITDQQRAIQHFPRGWAERHLPGAMRLKRHGLTFPRAFCNACMCSPSRATLMTGYFPAQHGVKYTLEEDMPSDQYPKSSSPSI